MTPLDWFLTHRVKVFPITPGKKSPAVPQGTHWADWDDFTRPRPHRPYGVVLGSLIVIDGDSAKTTAWIRANVPPTPFRVQSGPHHDGTPGRGVHFYFRARMAFQTRRDPNPARIAPAGDLRRAIPKGPTPGVLALPRSRKSRLCTGGVCLCAGR